MNDLAPRPIAFFHRTDVWGGAEESLLFNATDFLARGLPVVVLCSVPGPVAGRLRQRGLVVVETLGPRAAGVHHTRLGRRLAASLECRLNHLGTPAALRCAAWVGGRERRALAHALERIRPAVLYANMSASGDFHFLHLAASLGIGTISHQRVTPPVWTGARLTQAANRFCDHFVSNSEWTRGRWVAAGLRQDRHDVIHNAIPRVARATTSFRARLGLPDAARLIVSVGRLDPTKDFDHGIEAFAAIAGRFPDWHHVLLGEGSERPRLEALVRGHGLARRIHFAGEVPDAAAFMHQFDLLLHPTREEHFGRVVAEAMLHELPVIGHASGGSLEMIEEGIGGYLFREPAELSGLLAGVIETGVDADLRRRARTRIEALCGPANSDRLAAVVDEVAGRRAATEVVA